MARKSLSVIAAVLATLWSGAALAVYQETEVPVTDQSKAVPEQTVTLTTKEKDPKQPDKPAKVLLTAKDWTLPIGPKLKFESIAASTGRKVRYAIGKYVSASENSVLVKPYTV